MEGYKLLPYGVPQFERVISDNHYLVDKTRFITMVERQAPYLFLIRPRRFGKSLFLSMLETYYDVNKKERFQEFFGDLWIGSHPTQWQGRYLILKLDFSQVSGPIDDLKTNFHSYMSIVLDDFVRRYKTQFSDDFAEAYGRLPLLDANIKLSAVAAEAKARDLKMYLIVDEYDNFTNDVLSEHGEELYHSLTHAEGFYRGVFKKFKGNFDRIFMMGVSPVTLDDLTSGFNIGWHISADPKFNTMLGFSEQDVRDMLTYYKNHGLPVGDVDSVIADMKPWYDNYCFAEEALGSDPTIYNCDMVLYYINTLFSTGKRPRQMLSPNTRTDYGKLRKLIRLDKLDGNRCGVLTGIAENGEILDKVVETYPAMDLIKPKMFVSQLYYYGMLTISGMHGDHQRLSIPNRNIREQYYIWLMEHYGSAENTLATEEFQIRMDDMAIDGKWRGALEYISRSYEENSVVRSSIEGERNVQGYMHAYFTLCKLYLAVPEMEIAQGFSDFILMPDSSHISYPDVRHSYIIELKYVKSDATSKETEAKWQEGVDQANRYYNCRRAKVLSQGTTLHRIVMLFRSRTLERIQEL